MNPDIKAKWLTALRSGKYPQTRGMLHQIDSEGKTIGFCCLGVLCELAADEGIVEREPQPNKRVAYVTPGADGPRTGLLPHVVARWAGLATMVGLDVDSDDPWLGTRSLPGINDSGTSFADIADIIEEHA